MIICLSLLGVAIFVGTVVDIQLEYKIFPKIEWGSISVQEDERQTLDIKFPSQQAEEMYNSVSTQTFEANEYGTINVSFMDS